MTITPSDIYTISSFKSESDSIDATITFNEKHPIFSGHFPDNPIVPGVMQVQIIKDLMEKHLNQNLLLYQAKNIKFLFIISPLKNPTIEVSIQFEGGEDNSIQVKAAMLSEEIIFMKFAGILKEFIE